MAGRWAALVALAVALFVAAAPASAAEAIPMVPMAACPEDAPPLDHDPSPGYVVLDTPEVGGIEPANPAAGAQLASECVERIALLDSGLKRVLGERPGAQLELRYEHERRTWVAWLHERGGSRDLARVEVDDRTGEVTMRQALEPGEFPSRLTTRSAIDAASTNGQVQRVARRFGGVRKMNATARLRDGCCWEVDLYRPGEARPSMRVQVRDDTGGVYGIWTGIQIDWEMARGNRKAFGGDINELWFWIPAYVLFALVAIDWRRPRSLFNLDVVALLSIGVSHEAFLAGNIDWSVPLAVPPLVWLLMRTGWVSWRGVRAAPEPREPRTRVGRLALRPVPTWMLVVFCVLVAGVRIGMNVEGTNVIDVGYAGVAGARLELEGESPWGNMPDDNPRGDTYGPLAYLLYVPAVLATDDTGEGWQSSLPAAHAMSIVGDTWCVLALLVIGWRWISRRAGLLLAAAWLTCPWTLWAFASNVNDQLMAALALTAFALLPKPVLRGGLMAAAAAVKFAPAAALLPLLHCGAARRRRQAVLTLLGAAVVVGACWAWVAHHDGGTARFLERTIRFQADRDSPFSIWGLYGWELPRRIVQVVLAIAVVATALVPRVRDYRQVAAAIAFVTIAVQLQLMHWFYLYVPWFAGFVMIVLVAARYDRAAPPRYARAHEHPHSRRIDPGS